MTVDRTQAHQLILAEVTAIDIAPGCSSVKKGDFLSIDIGEVEQVNNDQVTGLKKESFHVVIFCLLLGKNSLEKPEFPVKFHLP